MITAILNGYRRGNNLDQQINALNSQSIKPRDVLLWYNSPGEGFNFNYEAINRTRATISNFNYGVWARFAFALNARTKYVCIFDDDTIPGDHWFENCLETVKTTPGLLGTNGLIFHDKNDYHNHERHGWINPNEQTIQVDLVGHTWFFERDYLSAMWAELPPLNLSFLCGEDMHFSYTLQKHMQINTYVPPHPKSDTSLWGSLHGWELGTDNNAISLLHVQPNQNQVFRTEVNDYFKELISRGWKLLAV
jgi:hypothetical protein